jgi:hypothetical protein
MRFTTWCPEPRNGSKTQSSVLGHRCQLADGGRPPKLWAPANRAAPPSATHGDANSSRARLKGAGWPVMCAGPRRNPRPPTPAAGFWGSACRRRVRKLPRSVCLSVHRAPQRSISTAPLPPVRPDIGADGAARRADHPRPERWHRPSHLSASMTVSGWQVRHDTASERTPLAAHVAQRRRLDEFVGGTGGARALPGSSVTVPKD